MRLLLGIHLLVGTVTVLSLLSLAASNAMPTITAKAYTAKFQIIIKDTGKSYVTYGTEHYDSTQQKSSLSILYGDSWVTIIMDYQDQKLIAFNSSADGKTSTYCAIMDMNDAMKYKSLNDNFHFFGGLFKSTGKIHMFSTKEMFSLNSTFTYNGTEDIDGITADKWSTHMVWTDDKDDFTLTYYFTTDKWLTAETQEKTSLPLRIEIQGTKVLPSGSIKKLHHYYEYISFETNKYLKPQVFTIPPGPVCQLSTINNKQIPKIPTEVTYDIESIDTSSPEAVRVDTVQYSKKLGLMDRITTKSHFGFDFNHGVRYQWITNGDYDCYVTAIDPRFDNDVKLVNNFVVDNGPRELASYDHTFTYDGKSQKRQISTYMFGGDVDTHPFSVKFASPDWNFSPYSNQRPISIRMDEFRYNFYNFKLGTDSWINSAAYQCSLKYRMATITFVSVGANYFYGESDVMSPEVMIKIRFAIAKAAGIKVSQVEKLKSFTHFFPSSNILQLGVVISDQPSAEKKYRIVKNYAVQSSGSTKFKTMKLTAGEISGAIIKAASACESKYLSGRFKCRNFDLCENIDGSFTVKYFEAFTTDVVISQSKNCNHYPRSVNTSPSVSLKQAIKNLRNDVLKRGLLNVNITIKSGWSRTVKLTATNVQLFSDRWSKMDNEPAQPLDNFISKSAVSLPKKILIESVTSETSCAQHCLDMGWNECQSMAFCWVSKKCYISPSAVSNARSTDSLNCGMYSRYYTTQFQEVKEKTMPHSGDNQQVFYQVANTDDCAKTCVQSKKIHCESFDFCPDTNECQINPTHMYDATASQIQNSSAACSHYSRNYLFDYKIARKTALAANNALQTVNAGSPEKCAFLCKTGYDGAGCIQFDFCSDNQVCRIVSVSSNKLLSHVPSASCDTYSLKDVQKAVNSGKLASSPAVTFSNASFAGLAIGMIVLGIIIGAGLVYVLYKQHFLNKLLG